MLKKLLTSFMVLAVLSGSFSSIAFAEEVTDEVGVEANVDTDADTGDDKDDEDKDEDAEDEVEVSVGEEVEVDTADKDEEVFYEEDSDKAEDAEVDETGEVIVEDIEIEDLTEETVEDYNEADDDGEMSDTFLLSVRWGYFLDEGQGRLDLEPTDWSGTVSFDGTTVAIPVKLLRFEPETDFVDFDRTTATETAFNSQIWTATDGLLFKVKTDLTTDASVTFNTAYSEQSASIALDELVEAGVAEFDYGDYAVLMKVWTPEELVEAQADGEVDRSIAGDADGNAWYAHFMNFSIGNGFFGGDRDTHGKPKGTIRPGDQITRLEMLKVEVMLAVKAGVLNCDANTVTETSETDWLGDHWARGYVQCVEDAGIELTLLNDVIAGDPDTANAPALRWEVVVTLFELMGLDVPEFDEALLDDLDAGEIDAEFTDAINEAVEIGVISGYPDHTFKPTKAVNRAEMMKIISLFDAYLDLSIAQ